jgi:pSer/pThr/pTyr-binding forkhead associated (FHA) protein/signal transduction histidine kinase
MKSNAHDAPFACLLRYPTDKSSQPIEVPPRGLTIGRDAANSLQLSRKCVSRYHAKIEFKDGQYVLSDLDSSNGTYINKIRIEQARLENNDKVFFGSRGFIFLLEPAGSVGAEAARASAADDPVDIVDTEPDFSVVLENNVHAAVNKFLAPPLSGKKLAEHSILAYQRLSHLYQLTELLRSAKDTDTILARGIGLILQALPSAKCAVALRWDDDAQSFDVTSVRFCKRDSEGERVTLNRKILERVVQEELALVRCTGSRDAAAFICVPFFEGDNVIGALQVLAERRSDAFSENDMEFTAAVAKEMAQSIENCRLHYETVDRVAVGPGVALGMPLARYIETVLTTRRYAIDTLDDRLRKNAESILKDNWQAVYNGLECLAQVTADILEYEDAAAMVFPCIDVNSSIEAACALLEEDLADAGIALDLLLAPDLPEWPLQASLLQKTLINLIFDARNALPEKGPGRITISTRMLDPRSMVIEVTGNGQAIDADPAENGCEPRVVKGRPDSELKMSMVRKFAALSWGGLRIESQPGGGIKYSLVLPKTTHAPA